MLNIWPVPWQVIVKSWRTRKRPNCKGNCLLLQLHLFNLAHTSKSFILRWASATGTILMCLFYWRRQNNKTEHKCFLLDSLVVGLVEDLLGVAVDVDRQSAQQYAIHHYHNTTGGNNDTTFALTLSYSSERPTTRHPSLSQYCRQQQLHHKSFNPFLFIRGLSCPRSVQTTLTQNCLELTIPRFPYDFLP